MKKTPKNAISCETTPPDLKPLTHNISYDSASQATRESLNAFLNAMCRNTASAKMPDAPTYADYVSKTPRYTSSESIQPLQYYPRMIIDGVDIVKMLTDIAVVTGALRDSTSVVNLDVVQHYSAERLAHFIINDSKKIISGSGDAVAELTEWLKSKAE